MLRKRVVSALLCAAAALACLAPMPTTTAGQPDPATDTTTSTSASSTPKKTPSASDAGKQDVTNPSSPSTAKPPIATNTGKKPNSVGTDGQTDLAPSSSIASGSSSAPGTSSQTKPGKHAAVGKSDPRQSEQEQSGQEQLGPQEDQAKSQTQQPAVGPQGTCTPTATPVIWSGATDGRVGNTSTNTDTITWTLSDDCKMTATGSLSHNYNYTTLPWQQALYKTQATELTANLTLNTGLTTMANWFNGMTALTTITIPNLNITHLNFNNDEGVANLFKGCTALTTLHMEKWTISQSTYKLIAAAIISAPAATTVDLARLDTGNATNISGMFMGCTKLTDLVVSGWDTSNVTDMRYMFQNCKSLTSLNLSSFNTSQVTDMGFMFQNCKSLTSLTLTGWNTEKVTSMNDMFQGCTSLTSLTLSNFNTSQVANMDMMFSNCSSLTSLTLSSFNTSQVTSMSYMFQNCSRLTSLTLSNFNTSQVTDMSYMFSNCSSLTSLDLSSFNTNKITNSYSAYLMFDGCDKITQLRLGPNEDKLTPQVQSSVFTASRAVTVMVEGRQTGDRGQYSFYSDKTPENVYQVSAATWFKVADRGIRYGRPADTGFFPSACVSWDNKPTSTCTVAGSTGMTPPASNQKLKDWKSIDDGTTYIPDTTVSMPSTARFITVEPEWEVQVTPVSSLPMTGGRQWMLVGMLLIGASLLALTATATLRDLQRNSHSL